MAESLKVVGQRTPRLNGPDIVTGLIQYADDVHLPGTLYGSILRSPHAHARIKNIDVSKARKLAGVIDVVTAADIPNLSLFAAHEVCYEGEKVAAVAAIDPDIAEDALELIRVEYEVLPAVSDPVVGMAADAPESRLGAPCEDLKGPDGRPYRNLTAHHLREDGDVDKAFAESDAIVEFEYSTPFWHQTYMEPNAATARPEADGRITVWTSGQGSFSLRDAIAGALKIPKNKVRVVMAEMGGGFGAKNGIFIEAEAALLAQRTGKPVKITMNREEEFRAGRPAPGCWVRLKTGAKKDGTLTAVEGTIVWDGGISGRDGGVNRLLGLYKIPNVRLEGFAVRTNKPSPGAFRAPGAPQTALPRESNIDALAKKLGIDPVAFRLMNITGKGDYSPSGAPIPLDWLRDILLKTADAARWGKRRLKPNQGMGIACGEWTNGSGPTNAFVTMADDGTVTLLTGQVDITGVHTVMAQIVAEELGLPVGKVRVRLGDTDSVPYTSLSAGSKSAYSAGTAAKHAAEEARKRILKLAAVHLEVSESDLVLSDERVLVSGTPGKSVALAELAKAAVNSNEGPICGAWILGRIPAFPSYAVNVAVVEVDPGTGQIKLIDLIAGQDVGKALNPMLVEGQIEGGAVQAVAYGWMEGYVYRDNGKVGNPNLLDYAIPTAMDIPNITSVILEEASPLGPYGAKGVGEPPIIPGAAAIVNAVHDAIGVRVTNIPMTPERIVAALREKKEG
jgi:xanthine dehydrogenase molybdenum-binding subunit